MGEPKGPHDEDRKGADLEDQETARISPGDLDAATPAQQSGPSGRFVAYDADDPAGGEALTPGEDFGPFQILRSIGGGAMGQVYVAKRRDSGVEVALKLLHQRLGEAERARFLREGRLAATVSHPNSVYVYGVEEVAGVPVIAMELVSGSTLQELVVNNGPLEPARAVDMVLQLAAGLEAAAEEGVLHRDVKPANCFVAQDDTCKIGDYGLSRSLSDEHETQLTHADTFLGTPAFASPEQLRAEQLDKRSDIYSLGATLYYLLTAQAPFTASNFARLVYVVQQEKPKSPADIREGIPTGLARVVLRCLAKDAADRYQDYATLRAALRPFSSEAPAHASLEQRFAAGFIDLLAGGLVLFLWGIYAGVTLALPASAEPSRLPGGYNLSPVIPLLYFIVLEGRWGAALGKYLMRIRVEVPGRSRPGFARSAARATLFVLVPLLSDVLVPTRIGDVGVQVDVGIQVANIGLWLALLALLFVTARSHNGWAGLHDLASGTRVVKHRGSARRVRSRDEIAAAAGPQADAIEHLGSYEVVEELQSTAAETLLRARDPVLGRGLWIRRFAEYVPPVPGWRKTMARAGRLRWVHGVRDEGDSWDAYQAVPGEAFGDATCDPRDWMVARQWALDLAREIQADIESTEPVELGLDRVWIGKDGRARLLEFSMGERKPRPGNPTSTDLAACQDFLLGLLERTLHAISPDGVELEPGQASVYVPTRVQSVLEKLRQKAYGSLADFVAEFEAVEAGPKKITRRRRLVPIAATLAVSSLPLVLWLSVALPGVMLALRDPEAATMLIYLDRLQRHQEDEEQEEASERGQETRSGDEINAFERYIAGRFQDRLLSGVAWNSGAFLASEANRGLAQRLHDEYPRLDPTALAQAEQEAWPLLEAVRLLTRRPRVGALNALAFILAITLGAIAAIGLAAALVVCGGPLLRAAGITVVDECSRPVRRGRWLLRSLIIWSPGFVLLSFLAVPMLPAEVRGSLPAHLLVISVVATVCLIYAVGAVLSVRNPGRGPADRLARTRLVPY